MDHLEGLAPFPKAMGSHGRFVSKRVSDGQTCALERSCWRQSVWTAD